jgi:hypothetical protein
MHRLGKRHSANVALTRDFDGSGNASRGKAAARVHHTEYTALAGHVVPRPLPGGVRRMVGASAQLDAPIGGCPLSGLGRLSSLGDVIGEGKSKAARQFATVPTTNPFPQQLCTPPQKRQESKAHWA